MFFSFPFGYIQPFYRALFRTAASCSLVVLAESARYLQAQDPVPRNVAAAEVQLNEARSTLEETWLLSVRQNLERCIQQSTRNSRCYYDLGRVDWYLIDVRERQKDKQGALRLLDSAIQNTQHSIDLEGNSADAHALLADLYGRKIGYGGMLAGMRLGPRAEAETNRALQLDPNDPRIYVVVGRRQLYSPKMFGGDIDKAIDSFRRSTKLDPHSDEAFVWLAIAYAKKGDSQSARAAVDEALRLNNLNIVAREIRSAMK